MKFRRTLPGWCAIVALAASLHVTAQESRRVAGVETDAASIGYVLRSGNARSGFVRHPSGRIEIFDAPGAGSGAGQGTVAQAINDRGEVGGYEIDANDTLHGFLRTRTGAIFVFRVPGAGPRATGWFYDEEGVAHGWKRAANGAIQVIDAADPEASASSELRFGFERWAPGAATPLDATQLATARGQ